MLKEALGFLLVLGAETALQTPNITADESVNDCFEGTPHFQQVCNDTYHGVAIGGQCFFVSAKDESASDPWTAAWQACAKYGSVVGLTHTSSEYSKVLAYIKATLGKTLAANPVLMALKDYKRETGNCIFYSKTIGFYKDVNNTLPGIYTNNTWIARAHKCDDTANQETALPRCFMIGGTAVVDVNDLPCMAGGAKKAVALCQITSKQQSFVQTKVCLGEYPYERTAAQTAKEYGMICSSEPWCRSFNFILGAAEVGGDLCEKFTWSINDTKERKNVTGCYHFNSVE